MTDVQGMLDKTSAAIAQVGAPDEAAWRFARAWMHATRAGGDSDLTAALADFDALPAGFPGRAKLASILVGLMVRRGRTQQAVALTAIADEDPRPLTDWPATAAAVRSRALLESAMHGGPGFNIRAAIKELDQLAATAAGTRPQQDMVESARVGMTLMRDIAEHNIAELVKSPERIRVLEELMPGQAKLASLRAITEVLAAASRGDLAAAGAAMRAAQDSVSHLPPGDPARGHMADMARTLGPMLGLHDDLTGKSPAADPAGDLAELRAMAAAPGLSVAERALRLHNLGFAEMGYGFDADEMLDSGIGHLREAIATAGEHDHRLVYYLSTLGTALLRRVEMLAGRADLDEGIRLLEEARRIAGAETHAYWTILTTPLAHAYRLAGKRVRGREVALSGLRGHAWNVLLQPTVADVHLTARHAAEDAVDVARWCLQDSDAEGAATALDSGRALILYAATETRDLGGRLADEGRPDLAERWRTAVADHGGPEHVPGELRREVISALARIPLDAAGTAQVPPDAGSARLLAPPQLDEVRAALTSLGVDALVYLVPGAAVVVPAGEPPTWVVLPRLGPDWGAEFDSFLTATTRESRVAGRVTPSSAGSLDDLCERAWTAAIGPVLAHLGPEPRIVLVPMGELARIPWHAARRKVEGRWRYAVEDAVVSYAPSARLLCDVAWRGAVPAATGCLIVADPDTGGAAAELRAARNEAWAIREAFYPAARYVGRMPDGGPGPDGVGSRAEVVSWLGADEAGAVLHLACHGMVSPGADETSYLLLAGGERLSAEELVSSAAAVGRPIALAVLGACSSGVCGRGDDEAYSLSTTLLANNVATVVGTQWSVPDSATSVLMFAFHHFRQEMPAADALRAAQIWMITRGGERRLEGMPAQLCAVLDRIDTAAPAAWAAFVHFGR